MYNFRNLLAKIRFANCKNLRNLHKDWTVLPPSLTRYFLIPYLFAFLPAFSVCCEAVLTSIIVNILDQPRLERGCSPPVFPMEVGQIYREFNFNTGSKRWQLNSIYILQKKQRLAVVRNTLYLEKNPEPSLCCWRGSQLLDDCCISVYCREARAQPELVARLPAAGWQLYLCIL